MNLQQFISISGSSLVLSYYLIKCKKGLLAFAGALSEDAMSLHRRVGNFLFLHSYPTVHLLSFLGSITQRVVYIIYYCFLLLMIGNCLQSNRIPLPQIPILLLYFVEDPLVLHAAFVMYFHYWYFSLL